MTDIDIGRVTYRRTTRDYIARHPSGEYLWKAVGCNDTVAHEPGVDNEWWCCGRRYIPYRKVAES